MNERSHRVVDARSQDWYGEFLPPLISTPCYPAWGSSFGSKGFYKAIWKAWEKQPAAKTIIVFVAGNDLFADANAEKVAAEMDGLEAYYQQHGVRVVYIDVVPLAFHAF